MSRLERMRVKMADKGIPAVLVMRPENIRYLTGYTGEGCLFVDAASACILTDFRYTEQAARQSPECGVMRTTHEDKTKHIVKRLVDKAGCASLGVELDYITYDSYAELKDALPGVELVAAGRIPETLRAVKDASEIAHIKKAAEISCKAFEELLGWVREGMTEKQIQIRLNHSMLLLGAEKVGFDTIVCAGPNGSLPHAVSSDRPVQKGELLTLDFGAQYAGYKSDMTRTIAIGAVSSELREMYELTLEAQLAALECVKPGALCSDVDKVARDLIDKKYPGAFGHGLGHGVGLAIHEDPRFSMTCKDHLEIGHVMTVEPGIYIEGLGGCRIEDLVIVTADGYENLISAQKQLTIV